MLVKKILFVPAMAAFMVGGTVILNSAMAAAKSCAPSVVSYVGNQDPDDDEFLYRTQTEFDSSMAGYQNSGKKNSGSGHAYECDGSLCSDGTIVELPAGHVFKGKKVNHKEMYECDTGVDDKWKPTGNGVCAIGGTFGNVHVGGCYHKSGDPNNCTRLTKVQCSGITLTDNNGIEFELVCRDGPLAVCKAVKCPANYKLDSGPGKCIVDISAGADVCDEKVAKSGVRRNHACFTSVAKYEGAKTCFEQCTLSTNNKYQWIVLIDECDENNGYTCEAKYDDGIGCQKCVKTGRNNRGGNGGGNGGGCKAGRSSLEGKACCDLPGSVAKWNAPNCVCVDTNKEFRIENGKGVCVDKTAPVVQDKCDCAGTAAERINMRTTCAKNPGVLSVLDTLDAECKKAEKECDGKAFTVYMNTVREQAALPNCGVAGGATVEPTANVARITSAITSIEKRVSNLDSSVWKTAEGNFNGARLASDSIAGVVLGTAGGLITSNVVKKNQIKSGFEDIVCTVGGQVVGNYGDQITVGIQ